MKKTLIESERPTSVKDLPAGTQRRLFRLARKWLAARSNHGLEDDLLALLETWELESFQTPEGVDIWASTEIQCVRGRLRREEALDWLGEQGLGHRAVELDDAAQRKELLRDLLQRGLDVPLESFGATVWRSLQTEQDENRPG